MKNEKLITVWEITRESDTIIYPHRHSYYELVYYHTGTGTAGIGGKKNEFSPGTFVLIPPDSEHDERHVSGGRVCCVGFACTETLPRNLYRDDSGRIRTILGDMMREASEQPPHYDEMLAVKLRELILDMLSEI